MNFLGETRGSKWLISQNPLLKIVSKKYGLVLRAVENKIEIIILSVFVGKKLKFSKYFNIFVILAYELHNTGCIRQNENPANFNILKRPLLVQTQMLHLQKALDLCYLEPKGQGSMTPLVF